MVLSSKLSLETASQIYYCDVQIAMEVILRTVDCSCISEKRLLEIRIDQTSKIISYLKYGSPTYIHPTFL